MILAQGPHGAHGGSLIACHACDLLQRETPLAPGGTARWRA